MRVRGIVIVVCAFMLACWMPVRADDAPAGSKPDASQADPYPPIDTSKVHLTQPWSRLRDLTADQIERIKQIHGRANIDRKRIKTREKSDILGILSQDQKTELGEAGEKASVDRKIRAAEKTAKKTMSADNSDDGTTSKDSD